MADITARAIYNNIVRSVGLVYGALPAGAIATVLTAAGAWVYGTYVQITASTSVDYQIVGLSIEAGTIGATTQGEVTISTGGAGSEVDFAVVPISIGFFILPKPVFVPLGTRIAARVRTSSGASDTVGVKLVTLTGM